MFWCMFLHRPSLVVLVLMLVSVFTLALGGIPGLLGCSKGGKQHHNTMCYQKHLGE